MEKSTKFNLLIESYINGNISYVKDKVKNLSKENRKDLYNYCRENWPSEANFFFKLI